MFIAIVVAVLIVALCVAVIFAVRNSQRMNEGRAQIEETILDNLTMILRTYDRFPEPKADIGGELLPEISKHLHTAYAQNNTLIDLHGASTSILDNDLYSQINEAIDALDREVKADRIVNAAENALTPYVERLRQILAERTDAQFAGGMG